MYYLNFESLIFKPFYTNMLNKFDNNYLDSVLIVNFEL